MAEEIRAAHRALAWNVLDKRRAQHLTREEAAWRAELDARQWARIEAGKGNPTLTTIVKVAVALGVAIGDLFAPVQR
jgi:XRE family transcriptional regulator, regulator of sulfur utilization